MYQKRDGFIKSRFKLVLTFHSHKPHSTASNDVLAGANEIYEKIAAPYLLSLCTGLLSG
jgi:hypothetical protein